MSDEPQEPKHRHEGGLHAEPLALFADSPDAIVVADRGTGRLLEANAAGLRLFGWTPADVTARSWGELTDPTDARWLAALESLYETGGYHGELRCVRSDGAMREVDATVFTSHRHRSGSLVTVSILRDVTERKVQELRRQESWLQLQKIAQHVPGLIFQFRLWPDGRMTFPYASAGIRDVYGITPEQARVDASIVLNAIHPCDRQPIQESIFASARAMTVWRESFRVNLAEGRTRWLEGESTPEPLEDGSTVWHGYIRDITERRDSEERLLQLSLAVEQSPASIVITDLDARIVYVNEAFLQKSGYSYQEVLGRNPRMLQTGKTPTATYFAMWETLLRGETWIGELINRRKDGSEYTEQASITPLRQANGRVTHYVSVKEDVTDIRRAERELDTYRHGLEQLVTARTQELAAARDEAQGASRQKSAFLANMSHEIRTPLNAIIGFTDLLRSEGAGPVNDEQARQLGMVNSASRHLLALISDILDISKIEAGELEVEAEPVDLGVVILRAEETMRLAASEKNLQLDLDVDPALGQVTGDERRIYQVLINLLSNAIKFSDRGSIRIAAKVSDGVAQVTVADQGIGIEDEDQAQLFQPFRQVGLLPTRRHDGVGLGLAISRQLIHLQGGSLWLHSEPGRGSTFGFSLPAIRSA